MQNHIRPINIKCSERRQAIAAHNARTTREALDIVRAELQGVTVRQFNMIREPAFDRSGRRF